MRFGLAGTGYWAQVTHGLALAQASADPASGVEFVSVWGRDPARTAATAELFGVRAAASFAAMLDEVDAVAFAVAPAAQAALATQAAQAGKHLLLEKPIAISLRDADQLAAAVEASGVASVVFFTALFNADQRAWVEQATAHSWLGGWARWVVPAFADDSPYAGSAWRREKGALWDVGPHALSLLVPTLGAIADVDAVAGSGDLVHLVFQHEGGATSTATLTLAAPPQATNVEVTLWGTEGLSSAPPSAPDQVQDFRCALSELVASAAGDRTHPCDVRFGRTVVAVLERAEHLAQGR